MFRIKKPRNFSFIQLAFVCAVGVLGGAYIYQPLLQKEIKANKIDEQKPETENHESMYKLIVQVIFSVNKKNVILQNEYRPTRQSNSIGLAVTGLGVLFTTIVFYRWKIGK